MSVLSKLDKTVKLGDIDIECFVKGESDSERYGVIHPISSELTDQELTNHLHVRMHPSSTTPDPDCQITKVERLKKKVIDRDGNKKWIPSESVKITFSGVDLPFAAGLCSSYLS